MTMLLVLCSSNCRLGIPRLGRSAGTTSPHAADSIIHPECLREKIQGAIQFVAWTIVWITALGCVSMQHVLEHVARVGKLQCGKTGRAMRTVGTRSWPSYQIVLVLKILLV